MPHSPPRMVFSAHPSSPPKKVTVCTQTPHGTKRKRPHPRASIFRPPPFTVERKRGEDHLGKIFISRPPLSPPFPPTVPSPPPTQGNKAEREGSGKGRKVGEEAEKRGGEMAPGKQRQGRGDPFRSHFCLFTLDIYIAMKGGREGAWGEEGRKSLP